MTLTRKIYAGYVAAIVLLVILAGLAIYNMNTTKAGYEAILRQDVALRYTALHTQYSMRDVMANLRGLQLYADKQQEYVDSTDASLVAVDQDLKDLAAAAARAGRGEDEVAKAKQLENRWRSAVDHVVSLIKAGDNKQALAAGDAVVPMGQDLIAEAERVVKLANEQVQVAQDAANRTTTRSTWIVAAIAAVFIVLAIALAFFIGRSVKRSLRSVADQLMGSSSEMLAVSSQVATSASETATSIAETTSTVVEVKQTAQLVSEKAGALMEMATETARISDEGTLAVEETVSGIERMGEQMSVITDSIVRLSDQTSTISDIIATVNDLAEQSNLLSVNAAIEAAKAGDQGKGFAVVAQEVKNLADQSKQAVVQVRGILADIEKATSAAVMATELGGKSIENGAKQSLQSGEAIDKLAESVAAAVAAIQQTVASTEQQFAGLDQINSAMDAISEASAQNVAGTRQIETEVQHLRDTAASLRALIDRSSAAAV